MLVETNGVLGTSYTSEDSDLVATEQSYAAMENELQSEIDAIESTHSGYDEPSPTSGMMRLMLRTAKISGVLSLPG